LNAKQSKQPELSIVDRMNEKLKGARFRFINEALYTKTGEESDQMFTNDPETFRVYHEGYELQKRTWPVDPLDVLILQLKKLPKDKIIADMGCGSARLAESIAQTVHSFDLIAVNERVTACDMSQTPLEDDSVDICLFCLSLMGTNLSEFLIEANRILKQKGTLKIAEISSRFTSVRSFRRCLEKLGFAFVSKNFIDNDDYFIQMDFEKIGKPKQKKPNGLYLNPCLYKKR